MLKGKRILITGASGYIGSWLAEYALRGGAHVRILLRKIPPHLKGWASKYEIAFGDITNSKTLPIACHGCEIVWHAASANEIICASSFEKALAINVSGAYNMLEAALKENVGTFLKLSTFHVYGYNGSEPLSENMHPRPTSTYGLTNLMGDLVGLFFRQSHGLNVVIPRISNGYGAPLFKEIDRWTLVMNDICKMAFEKKEISIKGSGLASRDFISIKDIFVALSILSVTPHQDAIFHIGGEARSILEIAQFIKRLYQQRYGVDLPIYTQSSLAEKKTHFVNYDITKLKTLGFMPQSSLDDEIQNIFSLLEQRSN